MAAIAAYEGEGALAGVREHHWTEEVMRAVIIAAALAALAVGAVGVPAMAAKTKMGCEIGKETWDASAGKCVAGQAKWGKKGSTKSAAKKK